MLPSQVSVKNVSPLLLLLDIELLLIYFGIKAIQSSAVNKCL